ncbi:MAG: hypothetical protein AB7P24_21450 [Nitrospira sp.]|jgi:hypothetical protein|nr:hypothetical protein [Nitrospira sp.]MDR4466032.1 hypothetical protein [Nitrospira sp.]MDR4467913.1 hypothetical protein [Nitrospira sp.]
MTTHSHPSKVQSVTKFTCGSSTATVGKNEGEKGMFYNVTITHSYKTSEGTWKRGLVQPERPRSGFGLPRPR